MKSSKHIIKSMKECEKKGMDLYNALERCIIQFKKHIKISEFRTIALKNGIIFKSSLDSDYSEVPEKIKKFIIKKKDLDIFSLRDAVIIKFKREVKTPLIKTILRHHEIKSNASRNRN